MNLAPLLAPFRSLAEEPFNAPVRRAMAKGARAVGYTCRCLPLPLLGVSGLLPLRLRAPGSCGTPMADTYLSSVLCPYVRALLEHALEGHFDRLDGWVLAASCDHARRLHDNIVHLLRPAFAWVVDVPHRSNAGAIAFYAEELGRLGAELNGRLGVDCSAGAIRASIVAHNEHVELLRQVADHCAREGGALGGGELLAVLVADSMAPRAALKEPLTELLGALGAAPRAAPPRARLLLVGSGVDEPRYVDAIESQGARVVADRHCVGSLPGLEPIPTDGDPLWALAEFSLQTTRCPRMMEQFPDRLGYLLAVARRFRVDGIVVVAMKFCDLWGVESSLLAPALRAAGWPVLRLEREYAHGGEAQLRTRVQAFLESIGR